jgi:alcohol dehydrogenase class IV
MRRLFFRTDSLSPRSAARRAAQSVYELIADVNLPVSLREMGFRNEDVDKMAEICVTRYPRLNNPRDLTKEDGQTLFRAMGSGNLNEVY